MTSRDDERKFPHFVTEWQPVEGDSTFTPLDYLGAEDCIEATIAAQWLFCPEFLEYRGGVFFSKYPESSSGERKASLDAWISGREDQMSVAERNANLVTLPDVFSGSDTEPYEEDLSQLARSIAECWRALLKMRFPDREFTVEVFDDWDDPYDPKITFYSARTNGAQAAEPETPGVTITTLPPGQFAALGDASMSIHVDLPPSLRDDFAGVGTTGTNVVDVRSISDDTALHHAITPDATGLDDALARLTTDTVLLTSVEQLWVKNRPVAERLLTELPAALTAARDAGHPVHVALADLASETVTAILDRLRGAPATATAPIPVFHYPPSA